MKKIILILFTLCLSLTALAQSDSFKATDNANDPNATYKLYPDAGPDSRDGQRAFRGDEGLFCSVGHGVGEKHLVHSLLELL